MVFRVAVDESLHALRVNKIRSALTSLGIVIGIGSVITLVSAGQGAHRLLEDKLESVGKDVILIRAGSRTQQGMVADFAAFSNDDVAVIRREAGPLLTGPAAGSRVPAHEYLLTSKGHRCRRHSPSAARSGGSRA